MEQKSIIKSKEDSDKAGPQALVGGMLRHLSSEIKSNQEEETTCHPLYRQSHAHTSFGQLLIPVVQSSPDAGGIDVVFSIFSGLTMFARAGCHKLLDEMESRKLNIDPQ
jgi:hypothetical protein